MYDYSNPARASCSGLLLWVEPSSPVLYACQGAAVAKSSVDTPAAPVKTLGPMQVPLPDTLYPSMIMSSGVVAGESSGRHDSVLSRHACSSTVDGLLGAGEVTTTSDIGRPSPLLVAAEGVISWCLAPCQPAVALVANRPAHTHNSLVVLAT